MSFLKLIRPAHAVAICIIATLAATACKTGETSSDTSSSARRTEHLNALTASLDSIVRKCPGDIGIALLTDEGDTITAGPDIRYPLMSVFKLHQAIALLHDMRENGESPDTIVSIPRSELNAATWSPMLKDYSSDTIRISVRDLLRYTLTQSDNNASNYLFNHFTDVDATYRFIATIIPENSFRLAVTEDEMWHDHARSIENYSSPLAVALLINKIYTDSVIDSDSRSFICHTLRQCTTGTDRIVSPLRDVKGISIGHKTGSGYRQNGLLMAHNDAAFITLPDGRHYTLVALTTNFPGTEEEAAAVIADVSAAVWEYMQQNK